MDTPSRHPLLCRSRCVPRCAGEEGGTTHTSPGSTHLAPAARLWGDPGPSGALSLRTRLGWRDAPAEGLGPAAASRRVHMWRGRRAGRGDREPRGEGLHLREVPGWSQPPSAERFSCPAARPAPQTREKFPRKNAWRAAGPWSRPESLRGKGRAAAAPGATRCRGLQGVIVGTPRGYRDPRGALSSETRLGAGWARAGEAGGQRGASGLPGLRLQEVGAGAAPGGARLQPRGPRALPVRPLGREGRGRGERGSGRGRLPGWARSWTPWTRAVRGARDRRRRRSPRPGFRGSEPGPHLHPSWADGTPGTPGVSACQGTASPFPPGNHAHPAHRFPQPASRRWPQTDARTVVVADAP